MSGPVESANLTRAREHVAVIARAVGDFRALAAERLLLAEKDLAVMARDAAELAEWARSA